ncbi:MAG: transposase, partial [Chloroflexota bacterium]|nr:transposase [Chloroflexota bacterium]
DVTLDRYIVMPNHIHGIILLTGESESTVTPARGQGMASGSLGAILAQYKSIVTKRGQTLAPAAPRQIWQRNYYDHIIRSQKSLDQIRQYIVENPLRWQDDEFYID